MRWVSKMRSTLAPGVDAWAVSLRYLMGAVLAGGGVLIGAFKYMQDNIVPKLEKSSSSGASPPKKKTKMSMKESAKFLMSSSYIRNLATLVISYGLCINIVEVSWKSKLKVSGHLWAWQLFGSRRGYRSRHNFGISVCTHTPCSKHSPIQMTTLPSWATSPQQREPSP